MREGRFGRFTVLAELGAGGMGRVFRAHDPTLGRELCIKVLRDDSTGGDLLAEARSASALNHPNICTVYDLGQVDGASFIAMELVDGRPLSEMIAAGELRADTALRLAVQIAAALAHAHQHGVVHGDLKGQNVLVTPQGVAKLVDFGLARTLAPAALESLTHTGAADRGVSGTLPYMAPETIRGARVTPAADVWAFGVLLQEMLSGARPFTGANAYELAAAIIGEPPRPSAAPFHPGAATVIGRCLEKDPAARYASARELFVALEPLVPAPGDVSRTAPAATAPRRGARLALAAAIAVVVSLAGTILWRWMPGSPPSAPAGAVSLIVLPFDNLSGNKDEDYFADGMTEALISDLSRIPTLKVTSRYSSQRYKALGKSPSELAQMLGVTAVVDGTVLRSGGQVRIGVRLVDAAPDRNRWAHSYTRELKDVLELQGEVARAIAAEIQASFAPEDEARLKSPTQVNPEAHEEYLKGRYHWNRRTVDGLTQAIVHFKRALELEPDWARAYAGLAQCYVLLPAFPIGAISSVEAFPQALDAGERAVRFDERLAEAHAALGYMRFHTYDIRQSETQFKRALALNPSDATTHFWYAAALASARRFDESIEQAQQAATLDPVSPIIMSGVSWMHHLAGRFEAEVDAARKALGLEPNFMMARYRLGEGLLHLGRYDEAIVELERARALGGESPDLVAAVAYAQGRAGRRDDALAGLARLERQQADGRAYVSPYALALVHTGLGNRDAAFTWLRNAIDERAWGAALLAVEADFAPLRSDARFERLIERESAR